jgi:uracil-DNA glycosylase family 4
MISIEKKTEQLNKIRDEILALKTSPLYKYRTENKYFPVIGEGNPDSNIMIIGEAPGKNEALTGRPFCGAAGKILDLLLERISLDRQAIYITNVVKDRPPENRDPTPQEIELYAPYLDRQIDIIQPKVIATLGRFSIAYIIQKFDPLWNETISKAHGEEIKVKASYGEITILPLYHPAATIYNQRLREVFFEDGEKLKRYL